MINGVLLLCALLAFVALPVSCAYWISEKALPKAERFLDENENRGR